MHTIKTKRQVLLSLQAVALACTVSLMPPASRADDKTASASTGSAAAADKPADSTATPAAGSSSNSDSTTAPAASPPASTSSSTPSAAPAAEPAASAASTSAPSEPTAPAASAPASAAPSASSASADAGKSGTVDEAAAKRARRKAEDEALKDALRKKKESEKGSYYGTIAEPKKSAPTSEAGTSYAESIRSAPKIAPPPSVPIPIPPPVVDAAHVKVAPSANPMGTAGKGWKDDASVSGSITLTRHVNTAKEMLEKGQWTLSKKHYGAAMQIEPANLEYMIGYYKSCLLGQDWKGVVNTLDKIFKQDPSKEKLYYADYGKALYFNNQVPEATVALKKAMTMGGNVEGVHETMLGMYTFQRDYPNMVLEYKAMIKINPAKTERMKALADLLWQTGSQKDATTYYRMYAKARPTDLEAQYGLGYALLNIKDYAGAIAAYRKALTVSPGDARSKQGLDYALAQQKAAAGVEE